MQLSLLLLSVFVIFIIWTYNSLIKKKLFIEEAYSGIDVQLQKRYNVIPNLIKVVKSYVDYEGETFEKLIHARNEAIGASGVKKQEDAENSLNSSLLNVMALAESHPELRASENYQQLQKELVEIEDDIEKSRRYYNGSVRIFNTSIAVFPKNIIASIFKFTKFEFFNIKSEKERKYPEIDL